MHTQSILYLVPKLIEKQIKKPFSNYQHQESCPNTCIHNSINKNNNDNELVGNSYYVH